MGAPHASLARGPRSPAERHLAVTFIVEEAFDKLYTTSTSNSGNGSVESVLPFSWDRRPTRLRTRWRRFLTFESTPRSWSHVSLRRVLQRTTGLGGSGEEDSQCLFEVRVTRDGDRGAAKRSQGGRAIRQAASQPVLL